MDVVSITLLLMLAVVASGALARMLPPAIPAPVVQIALGFGIGISADHRVELDPELFFLLFLPPLLFLDGWRIPKDDLRRDIGIIAELALGLVVFTVLGAGYLIHLMIPALPLAAAFCLAAVLSPTDPIAVSAVAERIPVPPRLMHILEGESMFNDASGLVCLRFAVAAAVSGSFSLPHAAASFLWLAGGGLAVGVGVTFGAVRARDWITARFGEEAGWQILVSLLIPFGAYLLAERLGCSGILAAVSGGVAMTFAERPRALEAESRMRRNSVWDALQFAMNGIIFVLLGEQLPQIFAGAVDAVRDHGRATGWWLALYVLAITAGLAALRFAWVWCSLRLTLFRAKEARPFRSSDLRLVGVMSVAGVRGALTLAGILTLPLTLADGSRFPGRDFVIFLAASVILVSLAVASIGLPLLLRGLVMPPDPQADAQEAHVRAAVCAAAVRAVEGERPRFAADPAAAACYEAAAEQVAADWRARAEPAATDPTAGRRRREIERALNRAALRAARDEAVRLARTREAPSLLARRIIRELDLAELRSAP
jgi:monovalent cation/hydrogen antiporter